MENSNEKMDSISELLPENLSDSAITEIAELVDEVITEQVQEKVSLIEAKVKAFLRTRVDEVKSYALMELEAENETFKNAHLFESMKSLMALEMNRNDSDSAMASVVDQNDNYKEDISVLTEELEKSFTENNKLEAAINALASKLEILEEENGTLHESVEVLEESREKPFKSSEQAVMISENVDEPSIETPFVDNAFLTDDIMKFMPFTSKAKER